MRAHEAADHRPAPRDHRPARGDGRRGIRESPMIADQRRRSGNPSAIAWPSVGGNIAAASIRPDDERAQRFVVAAGLNESEIFVRIHPGAAKRLHGEKCVLLPMRVTPIRFAAQLLQFGDFRLGENALRHDVLDAADKDQIRWRRWRTR